MKTSCKFATSPDILVTKEKKSVANVTVLVAMSSPDITMQCIIIRRRSDLLLSVWVSFVFCFFFALILENLLPNNNNAHYVYM